MDRPDIELFDQWANETHLNDEGHWAEIKAYIATLEQRAEAAEHNFGVEHEERERLRAAIEKAIRCLSVAENEGDIADCVDIYLRPALRTETGGEG